MAEMQIEFDVPAEMRDGTVLPSFIRSASGFSPVVKRIS
jgi:hypothetical protein